MSRKLTFIIAYAVLCVTWGMSYFFIKIPVESIHPLLLMGTRRTIAG